VPQYGEYPGAFVKNNVFFGGNLIGVREKLDYLASLGVSVIYLSPIFKAYSNHKYDTGDYMTVDEMFGGDKALKELIKEASRKDIKIILDGVFNHTGDDSLYFNKYGKYDSLGAYESRESEYYNWYNFKNHPDEYESWWGILVIAYGCYLTTSTYSSANHTAHKLAKGIRSSGMQFPSSRYEFTDEGVQIISLPEQEELGEPLGYSTFEKLGEDWGYFYLFPNPHGGYMIPKTEIEDAEAFREFIRHKTGKTFQSKMPPVAKLLRKLKDREQAPYHL
jgi:hypothetical protein